MVCSTNQQQSGIHTHHRPILAQANQPQTNGGVEMFVEKAALDAIKDMEDKLWESQIREHPKSVRMYINEVYAWCDEAKTATALHNRYIQISMALQFNVVVFYRIEGTNYRGFRFGADGSEYMSLYS
jgi:hypothetical protein